MAFDLTGTPSGFAGGTLLGSFVLPSINTSISSFNFFCGVDSTIKTMLVVWEQITPIGTAGLIDGFYLGEIKIEKGLVATQYSCLQDVESHLQSLWTFERKQGFNANANTGDVAFADGTTIARMPIRYMRKWKQPTIVVSRQNALNLLKNGTDQGSAAIAFVNPQRDNVRVDITTTGLTGGEAMMPAFVAATDFFEIQAFYHTEGL